VKAVPVLSGWLWFGLAFLAMFGMVMLVVAAADNTLLVVPAAACLGLAAYACVRLYCLLLYGR
jgi:hypothetical protein